MNTTRLSLAGLLCVLLAFLGAIQCDYKRMYYELTLCVPAIAEPIVNTGGNICVISNPLAQVEGD